MATTAQLLAAVAAVLLLAAAALAVFAARPPPSLGDALAARGWTLFTREGCHFCTLQLEALGGDYPRRVECAGGGCPGVGAFPTWRRDASACSDAPAEERRGFQDAAALRRMAGRK